MILNIFFGIVSVVLFLFVFWRKLKDDYTQEQVFSTGFYILFGITLGIIAALNFKPSWWFWSGMAGALLGLSMGVEKFKLRMFEALEASVYGGLILYSLYFLSRYVTSFKLELLFAHLTLLMFLVIFEILNRYYKRFSWYKSGRVGFSGLTIAGLFFIVRAAASSFFLDIPSLIGKSDVILSGIFAFISFISVYNLSRNTL